MEPKLVAKPPAGGDWSHEVKFDGYRSQIIIDEAGVRIFTRRGLDWTAKYRDLAVAAASLEGLESAIVDGEVIVLNEAGPSDFGAQGHHAPSERPLFRRLRSPLFERPRCARHSAGGPAISLPV
ncbi:ATP-dependent DNA ligase [Mesorhizobium tianshanense]|uniref:ATP-dependent DNA ligase n=1 Tax=Mesorhizobium tianshanense TaxID=39844 RepID=UPI0030B8C5B2